MKHIFVPGGAGDRAGCSCGEVSKQRIGTVANQREWHRTHKRNAREVTSPQITTQPRDKNSVWLLHDGQVIGTLVHERTTPAPPKPSSYGEQRRYYTMGISLVEPSADVLRDRILSVSMAAAGSEEFASDSKELPHG